MNIQLVPTHSTFQGSIWEINGSKFIATVVTNDSGKFADYYDAPLETQYRLQWRIEFNRAEDDAIISNRTNSLIDTDPRYVGITVEQNTRVEQITSPTEHDTFLRVWELDTAKSSSMLLSEQALGYV